MDILSTIERIPFKEEKEKRWTIKSDGALSVVNFKFKHGSQVIPSRVFCFGGVYTVFFTYEAELRRVEERRSSGRMVEGLVVLELVVADLTEGVGGNGAVVVVFGGALGVEGMAAAGLGLVGGRVRMARGV